MDLSAAPLRLDAIGMTLGGRRVLDSVSVDFAPGRLTAVLGPNGAGKSTLAQIAAGLAAPDAGHVTLGGRALAALPPRERARAIGYLPQGARVHWDLAVTELVALGRLPHRGPFAALDAADRAAIDAAMAATDIAGLADRTMTTLSGGEAARVHLARVLAGNPGWIIADEPLAGLDPAHQIDVIDRLREAARRGAGVIVILHDLAHAARAADAAVLLDMGRVVAQGSADAVLSPERLSAVYGVDWFMATDDAGAPVLLPTRRRD